MPTAVGRLGTLAPCGAAHPRRASIDEEYCIGRLGLLSPAAWPNAALEAFRQRLRDSG